MDKFSPTTWIIGKHSLNYVCKLFQSVIWGYFVVTVIRNLKNYLLKITKHSTPINLANAVVYIYVMVVFDASFKSVVRSKLVPCVVFYYTTSW